MTLSRIGSRFYKKFKNTNQEMHGKPISRTQIKKPMGNPFQEHEPNRISTSNSN